MSKKNSGLGRGLGALMPSQPIYGAESAESITELSLNQVFPNENQPRREFDVERLEELSASIKEYGIIQPLLVVAQGTKYMIVAGERRYRAAQKAGLTTIPCIIKNLSDDKILEMSLIENIQREDLSALEEAKALETLTLNLGISKTDLAKRLGKSRSYVSNSIRLLVLPPQIQELLRTGAITSGHARALLNIEDLDFQLTLAYQIVEKKLSVRDVEKRARKHHKTSLQGGSEEKRTDHDDYLRQLIIRDLEEQLKSKFQTQVAIKGSDKKGQIVIEYYSDEDLERIISLIKA